MHVSLYSIAVSQLRRTGGDISSCYYRFVLPVCFSNPTVVTLLQGITFLLLTHYPLTFPYSLSSMRQHANVIPDATLPIIVNNVALFVDSLSSVLGIPSLVYLAVTVPRFRFLKTVP